MEQRTQTLSTKFHRYFINKLKPTLIEHRKTVDHIGYFDKSWTNNNSESLNHVLKRAIDWKSQPLLDLVQIIRDVVDTQYKDLLRSLVSIGQYRLADSHKQFQVSKSLWMTKTVDESERFFIRFRNHLPPDQKTVTSKDGLVTVIKPRTRGRKKGQLKRKINERTTTIKKTKNCDLDFE